MPRFILEQAGEVNLSSVVNADCLPKRKRIIPGSSLRWTFDALDDFTQGYIEALFFTENEPGTTRADRMTTRGTVRKSWESDAAEGRIKDIPGDYGFADLAPETLADIIKDCETFQSENKVDLEQAYEETAYDATQAGRDFWLTRNGHGAGFWDRDELDWFAASDNTKKLQDTLSKACRHYNVDAVVGDDGKVYFS